MSGGCTRRGGIGGRGRGRGRGRPAEAPARAALSGAAPAVAESQPRADPRIRRTRAAIEEAFVRLVREVGYDSVSVEQVAEAAGVAKATFYRHYESKEALLAALSERLVYGLTDRIDGGRTPLPAGEHASLSAAYQHAAALRDLYQVCLADARARAAYTEAFARHSEEQFRQSLDALGREPQIPQTVMATFFAGAHVLLLERWLNGTIPHTGDEVASMELALFVAGAAWASRMTLDEPTSPEIVAALNRYSSDPEPRASRRR